MRKIFISYPTEDAIIAERINAAVQAMPSKGMDAFLDRVHMQGGQRIPRVLHEALKETAYFVAVGTDVQRRNFDWCGQELGFYEGSFPEEERRATCLYHQTIPAILIDLQCFKVQPLAKDQVPILGGQPVAVEQGDVYGFLKGLAKLNARLRAPDDEEAYWRAVPEWAARHALSITEGFFVALQNREEDTWFPQARLQISVENKDFFRDGSGVPASAEVTPTPLIYPLFKSAIPSSIPAMSWAEFARFVRDNAGNDGLCGMLSDVVLSVLPARASAKNDWVYPAPDGKFYRVILVRHSRFGNGRREFIFNLVETLEKVQSGDERTTRLVAGIVLGSKYRSLFHEEGAKYALDALTGLDPAGLAAVAAQLQRDLERINADAASDGLGDVMSLAQLFDGNAGVSEMFRAWYPAFLPWDQAMRALIDTPGEGAAKDFLRAHGRFLAMSRENNRTFLRLCIEGYMRSLGRSGAAGPLVGVLTGG